MVAVDHSAAVDRDRVALLEHAPRGEGVGVDPAGRAGDDERRRRRHLRPAVGEQRGEERRRLQLGHAGTEAFLERPHRGVGDLARGADPLELGGRLVEADVVDDPVSGGDRRASRGQLRLDRVEDRRHRVEAVALEPDRRLGQPALAEGRRDFGRRRAVFEEHQLVTAGVQVRVALVPGPVEEEELGRLADDGAAERQSPRVPDRVVSAQVEDVRRAGDVEDVEAGGGHRLADLGQSRRVLGIGERVGEARRLAAHPGSIGSNPSTKGSNV